MKYPEEFQREVNMEYYRGGMQSFREAGFMGLKSLITLNSGAFIVLLTFIGNTAAQSQFAIPLGALKASMFCFLAGLALVFLSSLQTYISTRTSSPYIEQEEGGWPDWLLTTLSIVFPVLSFVAFISGVFIIVWNVGPA